MIKIFPGGRKFLSLSLSPLFKRDFHTLKNFLEDEEAFFLYIVSIFQSRKLQNKFQFSISLFQFSRCLNFISRILYWILENVIERVNK